MAAETPRSAPGDPVPPEDQADRSPAEQLVDLCVYAPLGLVLDARSLLPGLVERGRQQVGVAKMVGEFAVKWGSLRLEAKVGDAQEQAMGLLRSTGLAPADDRDRSAGPAAAPHEAAPSVDGDTSSSTDDPSAGDDAAGSGGEAGDSEASEAATIDVATLAIVDYDNLSASQVVPRLDGLTDDELAAVGRYEASGRGRNTILNKVAQLQGGE
jgi:hypothetical protein